MSVGIIGQAAGLFAVTNIDDIVVLALFFLRRPSDVLAAISAPMSPRPRNTRSCRHPLALRSPATQRRNRLSGYRDGVADPASGVPAGQQRRRWR